MAIYLDDLRIGQRLTTACRQITAGDVEQFAQLTGDLNPVHLDEEYARHSMFGQRIVHGALTLSVTGGLLSPLLAEATLAFHGLDKVRFRRPVYLGQSVYVSAQVVQVEPIDDEKGILHMRFRMMNQDNKTVLTGNFSIIMNRRPTTSVDSRKAPGFETDRQDGEEAAGAPQSGYGRRKDEGTGPTVDGS